MTTWMEEDGLAKTVDYRPSPEEQRRFEERADDARYAVLDAAVARGAIPREACPRWASRLMENFDVTAEILDDLPDDEAAAERAYESDRRIRQAEEAYLDMLGVETKEHEYAESLPEAEQQWDELATALNLKAVA